MRENHYFDYLLILDFEANCTKEKISGFFQEIIEFLF